MPVQFQICGLCILTLLIIFYRGHKNLRLYKGSVFFIVLCIMTISLVSDILSLVAIHYRNILPTLLVKFACKSYIVTLIWGSWSALIYIISELLSPQKHKKITRYMVLIANLQALIIYLLPIYIYTEGNLAYTYGPATLAVYTFVILYITATLIINNVFRNRIHPRRRSAINLWMAIWLVSAALQFFNQELLLVGFASALGVLILFAVIENPEANIERRLGCFNSYALTEYLKQLYENEKSFCLLELSFQNEKFLEERGIDTNAVLLQILHLCGKDISAFKNVNLSLVLISESETSLKTAAKTILDRFSSSEILRKEALMTLTPCADAFSDSEELFRFLAYVQNGRREENEQLLLADHEMVSRYKAQFHIEREISLALAQDRVEVFLQPIYSVREQAFCSAEALVRIRKLNGELLSPGEFIPVAENNGQILELGERVFEKVCHLLKETDAMNLGIHYIEINLSVVQCEKEDLAQRLIAIAKSHEVDPRWINLEITETASINARKTLLENMKKLIAYGFSFSLDDFGKGQSNLMYVVEMPVSIIKLDYDIVKAFFHTPKAEQVVQAVIHMAHSMGLQVVAEGIETEKESREIIAQGVDYIQGFYYSKPLPEQEFLAFINRSFGQ